MLKENGHSVKFVRTLLVKQVLDATTAIFAGWSSPDRDTCWVYVGEPTNDYRSATIEAPPQKERVFLVFVLPDGTIDDWGWRAWRQDDHGLPEEVKGELVWRQTQN